MKLSLAISLFVPLTCHAQPQRPLKVVLLYDMEGVSGVANRKQTQFFQSDEYADGRKSLTADVNAAIAGLKAGGATEIVVIDGHGSGNSTGPDVFEELLTPPARMGYKDSPFDIYMDSYDHSVDAIVAVGMHAGAGNGVGFLSHTYSGVAIDYRVNGVPVNESMILALGAARLKIPLIMVCGDDQLEKEVRRNLSWVRYAAVKHAVDRSKAEPLARAEVDRLIETMARQALQEISNAKFPDFPGPYRFALTFQDAAEAAGAALLPGAELNGLTVQIRSNDFEEGYRKSLRLMDLAGQAGQRTAMQALLRAQPSLRTALNNAQAERRNHPEGQPAQAPGQQRRYWGAQ